jgi:hypothetical protein
MQFSLLLWIVTYVVADGDTSCFDALHFYALYVSVGYLYVGGGGFIDNK